MVKDAEAKVNGGGEKDKVIKGEELHELYTKSV